MLKDGTFAFQFPATQQWIVAQGAGAVLAASAPNPLLAPGARFNATEI